MSKQRFVILLILVGALSRLIPHAPNFTAVGAIALFAGARLGNLRLALVVPILALWISDLAINNILYAEYYEGLVFFTEGFAYMLSAMMLAVLIGRFLIRQTTAGRVLSGAFLSALVFFLVTNFGVWIGLDSIYPKSVYGLLMSYEAGIPFFRNDVAGTALYSGILFGLYEWVHRKTTLLVRA